MFNKSRYEWISELHRLKKFPKRNILNILQIRFDGLQAIEKEIFLNIGCFLNHKNQESIMNILNYLPLYPQILLRVFIDKSLIKLHYQQLWMCNSVQEMAKDRVCQESLIVGKRTRV